MLPKLQFNHGFTIAEGNCIGKTNIHVPCGSQEGFMDEVITQFDA